MDIHILNFVEASQKILDDSYTHAHALSCVLASLLKVVCKKKAFCARDAMMKDRSLQVTVSTQHVLPLACLMVVNIELHGFYTSPTACHFT